MDDARPLLTDETRSLFAEVLAATESRAGAPPRLPDRDFVEAVLHVARTGCPRRDLSGQVGRRRAVYKRSRRREARGLWAALFARLSGPLARARDLMLDSTVVRAHVHAAGAAAKEGGRRRSTWAARAAASAPRSTSPPPRTAAPRP